MRLQNRLEHVAGNATVAHSRAALLLAPRSPRANGPVPSRAPVRAVILPCDATRPRRSRNERLGDLNCHSGGRSSRAWRLRRDAPTRIAAQTWSPRGPRPAGRRRFVEIPRPARGGKRSGGIVAGIARSSLPPLSASDGVVVARLRDRSRAPARSAGTSGPAMLSAPCRRSRLRAAATCASDLAAAEEQRGARRVDLCGGVPPRPRFCPSRRRARRTKTLRVCGLRSAAGGLRAPVQCPITSPMSCARERANSLDQALAGTRRRGPSTRAGLRCIVWAVIRLSRPNA